MKHPRPSNFPDALVARMYPKYDEANALRVLAGMIAAECSDTREECTNLLPADVQTAADIARLHRPA